MLLRSQALLCAVRAHGEHGAIARLLTREQGLIAGYVPGARSRALRPLLIPGNVLAAEFSARGDGRLAGVRLELLVSRGPWLGEPLASAAIGWAAALSALALPEAHPYPALYDALGALLEAICHAPSARGWAIALAAYEALVLRELGYGRTAAPPPDADWPDLLARLARQHEPIAAHLLAGHARDAMAARAILIERLQRIPV